MKHPLFQQQLVRGLPDIDYHSDALCGACQKGKIVKTSFKSKDIVSTSRPLELLHVDLFGPVSTASIYGSKYGLVIVDDYSRWSWVKFLKSKDDSYDVFSKFCIQIQSEKELKILKVRSEKLLRLLSNQKTLFLLLDLWNYSILIYLDQLALHPYMGVNMEWL